MNTTDTVNKDGWLPNLDALRALAFLSVFISHSVIFLGYKGGQLWTDFSTRFLVQGDLGVNFFFVLSGFLITYLIFTEKEKYRSVSIKNFYTRRILRIWPVYFITLIIGVLLSVIIKILFINYGVDTSDLPFVLDVEKTELPWYIFFLGNFDMAFWSATALPIAVLWSVSIEEQFYVIWPWIIRMKKYLIMLLIILGILASFIYRYININDYNIVSYFSFSVMSDLLFGCLCGLMTFNKNIFNKIINLKYFYSGLMWLLLIMFVLFRASFHNDVLRAASPIIFSLISGLIIIDQVYGKYSVFKLNQISFLKINSILEWLGKRSYGLYCYHAVIMVCVYSVVFYVQGSLFHNNFYVFLVSSLITLILTMLCAGISFKYVESNILKLRKNYTRK